MIEQIKKIVKKILRVDMRRVHAYFVSDENRFVGNSGVFNKNIEARIIIQYHIIEKGLTMPNRRLEFGKAALLSLIHLIEGYESSGAKPSAQVTYAIGVVKEYDLMHAMAKVDRSRDSGFWSCVESFVSAHPTVRASKQYHFSKEQFYADATAPFADFAKARHCVRNYNGTPVERERIELAVKMACTTPSACNRNPGRVHCISNHALCQKILEVQGGNRGFGALADKVLIVTADMRYQVSGRERNDDYINGGMFLMNLCYALYATRIAYCILTWSQELAKDAWLRKVADIPDHETIVALLCVGEAPEEFDVAASPRRTVEEVLLWH